MSFIASSARASAFGLLARPLRAPTALAAPRAAVRAYSDKAAEQEAPKEDAEAPKEEGATDAEAQLKEKEERIKQLSDQVLYGKAELQNLQRRAAEEKTSAGQFGMSKLAKDLTESIDILDIALKTVPEPLRTLNKDSAETDAHKALADFYDGVSLTRKSLLDMLRTHGITQFNPTGEEFDPKLHEALYQAPIPGKTPGTVLDCSKVGYMIKDRLLRAAQVGVVQDTA